MEWLSWVIVLNVKCDSLYLELTTARIAALICEKGKTMEPYKIVMAAIVAVLEITAVTVLTVGWFKA